MLFLLLTKPQLRFNIFIYSIFAINYCFIFYYKILESIYNLLLVKVIAVAF